MRTEKAARIENGEVTIIRPLGSSPNEGTALRLKPSDGVLSVLMSRFWSGCRRCLEIDRPDTVHPLAPENCLDVEIAALAENPASNSLDDLACWCRAQSAQLLFLCTAGLRIPQKKRRKP